MPGWFDKTIEQAMELEWMLITCSLLMDDANQ